ncbi:AAA family ATPase [Phytohabitans sp. LJ34]|uniref:AAA family ATPase n=1 Tax=Phytohabitans sp. LJ34 TaxID=3452217 RepID=UPI003F8B2523
MTTKTIYAGEPDQMAIAQEVLDEHVTSSATGLCLKYGVRGPCYRRETATVVFSRFLRLPRLTPGLTWPQLVGARRVNVCRPVDGPPHMSRPITIADSRSAPRTAREPRSGPVMGQAPTTVLVAVIGPPGVGKSTVVAALASAEGMPVFRLRETIRARPELLAGLGPSTDPLGWVSLEAVRWVLDATFVRGRFTFGAATVLLDNFPGTAGQLDLLAQTAQAAAARVALLELRADMATIVGRVEQRRVCLVCGPDPHAPAVAAADDARRCGSCRMVLARRDTDVPRLHGLRLARYAANQPEIAELAAECGIAHLSVNADATMSEVCQAAHHAVHRLTALAKHEGSRS